MTTQVGIVFKTKFANVLCNAQYSNSDCGMMELSHFHINEWFGEPDKLKIYDYSGANNDLIKKKYISIVEREVLEQIKTGVFTPVNNLSGFSYKIYKAQIILSDFRNRRKGGLIICADSLIETAIEMRREDRNSMKMVVSPYTRNPNSGNDIRVAIIRTNGYVNYSNGRFKEQRKHWAVYSEDK